MTSSSRSNAAAAAASRRRRRRARERGASVFIVVLVIAMLTAIGVFAARSSRLSTTASGHARQMTQSHYLTEYAMDLSMALLSTEAGPVVTRMGRSPDPGCFGMANIPRPMCLRLFSQTLEKQLLKQGVLLEPPTAAEPGSLGAGKLDSVLLIELTNAADGSQPPGYDRSENGPRLQFYALTMTGTSRIRPTGSATWTSTEAARAFLLAGPLPPGLLPPPIP